MAKYGGAFSQKLAKSKAMDAATAPAGSPALRQPVSAPARGGQAAPSAAQQPAGSGLIQQAAQQRAQAPAQGAPPIPATVPFGTPPAAMLPAPKPPAATPSSVAGGAPQLAGLAGLATQPMDFGMQAAPVDYGMQAMGGGGQGADPYPLPAGQGQVGALPLGLGGLGAQGGQLEGGLAGLPSPVGRIPVGDPYELSGLPPEMAAAMGAAEKDVDAVLSDAVFDAALETLAGELPGFGEEEKASAAAEAKAASQQLTEQLMAELGALGIIPSGAMLQGMIEIANSEQMNLNDKLTKMKLTALQMQQGKLDSLLGFWGDQLSDDQKYKIWSEKKIIEQQLADTQQMSAEAQAKIAEGQLSLQEAEHVLKQEAFTEEQKQAKADAWVAWKTNAANQLFNGEYFSEEAAQWMEKQHDAGAPLSWIVANLKNPHKSKSVTLQDDVGSWSEYKAWQEMSPEEQSEKIANIDPTKGLAEQGIFWNALDEGQQMAAYEQISNKVAEDGWKGGWFSESLNEYLLETQQTLSPESFAEWMEEVTGFSAVEWDDMIANAEAEEG